jgi:23S rRNA pseudouridine1911/1915/1917 synthase
LALIPAVQLIVDASSAGQRLDRFLAGRGAAPTVAAARRSIAAGLVRVDGRRAPKGSLLRAGQVVEAAALPPVTVDGDATLPLAVLYEDADLVAVNKPAGIASHPLRAGDGPSVAAALVARYPECAAASVDPREGGLGHRLDRGTSGVLVAARHRQAWLRLREVMAAGRCEKVYLAEVEGVLPADPGAPFVEAENDALVVTAPIGRQGRRGGRVLLAGGRNPLPARTVVRARERRPATTLVEARIARGRAHQVRAHLAYLGCPVVGDDTYGEPGDGGLRLHAWTVTLPHPLTGERLHLEAPRPEWATDR